MKGLIDSLKEKEKKKVSNKKITHLHCHNTYSELDGYATADKHVKRAKELGMTHLAITNHNHLAGMLEFQNACKKYDVKPILGCELYYTEDTEILSLSKKERDKIAIKKAEEDGIVIPKKITKKALNEMLKPYQYDTRQYHILFLAKNQEGWKNLVKLQSEAAIKCCFNGRFLVDNKLMEKYSKDLICTTACIGSKPARLIEKGKIKQAEEIIDSWHSIFKENFYLEIQPLCLKKQVKVNETYIKWSKEKGIKLVATNDVHYPKKEDNEMHDILLCIGMKKQLEDEDRMHYSHDYWIRDYNEMISAFSRHIDLLEEMDFNDYMNQVKEALFNTNLIADQIEDVTLGSNVPLFPKVKLPKGLNADETLELNSFKRFYEYAKKKNMDDNTIRLYEKRLRTELDIIKKKNYSSYFLAVEDYIANANERGCSTGPSRGSAAGSFVSFINNIVRVSDPIEHGLLFFRFLTEDRVSPPDVDIDFCFRNRYKVIEYLEEEYGADHVCHIGTVTKLGVKNGVKDIGRVLGMDFSETNAITKVLDSILDEPKISFKMLDKLALGDASDKKAYEKLMELEEKYPLLFKAARELEGNIRNTGVHAAGVLVTPFPVTDLFPIKLDKEGKRVALYTGEELESLNAIKFDILGLKTITVIEDTLKMIDPKLTIEDMYKNDTILDDENVYKMISNLDVEGLFQVESDLFKMIIKDMQPDRFSDIVALTALCRPGPLSANMHTMYCNRKNGLEEIKEPLPNTMDIVKDTYGTLIYQEHLMLIAKRVAKFDDNQSDTYLRKATAKQKKDLMSLCRRWFIWGKINEEAPEGYDPNNEEQVMYDPEGKYGNPILGGVNNEYAPNKFYKENELKEFWKTIEGFCSYLFNKSHSVAYSVLTVYTAWLKYYYPKKFMAASISMLTTNEKETMQLYTQKCEDMGIKIKVPDINKSKRNFIEVDNNILYGFASVKGVGDKVIPEIIKGQPYKSLKDVCEKLPKKIFNKRVGQALIKAGAFDSFEKNRLKLLNEFYDIRKDKDERYDESKWSKKICMEFEEETLASSITHKTWFDSLKEGMTHTGICKINKIKERIDRRGGLMAFVNVDIEDTSNIEVLIFSSIYSSNLMMFKEGNYIRLKAKKDNGKLIASTVKAAKENEIEHFKKINYIEDD